MERRIAKVNISAAGGTAGEGSKTCKVTIPGSWLAQLGIDEAHRRLELSFDGTQISVVPYLDFDAFADAKQAQGHELYAMRFFDSDHLCSTILADYTDHTLRVRDEDVALIKTAFGKNKLPSWEDFERFLEERCIPRARSGLREYLDAIGVMEYDPIEIIRKTHGRMAEDQQWLEVEAMK